MRRHELGSTVLDVPPIGLGLAALCRASYLNLGHETDLDGDPKREHIFEVLDAAWESGIRYFDTGRAQGDAESMLSEWLDEREIPPGDVCVASKWGYVRAEELGFDEAGRYLRDHSYSNLRAQWDESTSTLGAHLQIYQIRSATFSSAVLEDPNVLDYLNELKGEGLHVGLTVRGPQQEELIDRALEVERDGEQLFETVQATWNLMERSAGPALHRAHEAGLGVVVKEVLANGRLTDRNQRPRYANEVETLRREADRLESTSDALALAAALEQPWVDVVLSGAATVDQLESNLAALEIEVDDEARRHLQSLERSPEVYWDERETLWDSDPAED